MDNFENVEHQSFKVDLASLRDKLFEDLRNEDVSDANPEHDAFEVEDINTRQNFVFIKRGDIVELYDSSRGVGKKSMAVIGPLEFPFGTTNADEYYLAMFRKALRAEENICFLGYVTETENSFEPI
jgi:hypothetical protein